MDQAIVAVVVQLALMVIRAGQAVQTRVAVVAADRVLSVQTAQQSTVTNFTVARVVTVFHLQLLVLL